MCILEPPTTPLLTLSRQLPHTPFPPFSSAPHPYSSSHSSCSLNTHTHTNFHHYNTATSGTTVLGSATTSTVLGSTTTVLRRTSTTNVLGSTTITTVLGSTTTNTVLGSTNTTTSGSRMMRVEWSRVCVGGMQGIMWSAVWLKSKSYGTRISEERKRNVGCWNVGCWNVGC